MMMILPPPPPHFIEDSLSIPSCIARRGVSLSVYCIATDPESAVCSVPQIMNLMFAFWCWGVAITQLPGYVERKIAVVDRNEMLLLLR